MKKKILVIGTFDSKNQEYDFLISQIQDIGWEIIALDVGTFSEGDEIARNDATGTAVPVELISNREVLEAAGGSLETVRANNDRGKAMKMMAKGAANICARLFAEERIAGVVGMGGSGGSSVISAAMRVLPIGIPKVLLSTMVGENSAEYVGCKDIVMIPSITDISGLNRISRKMITSTAAAVTGMAAKYEPEIETVSQSTVIAISMFGNTTECVNRCREKLEGEGYEVIVFHATGVGGRTMESLIDEGLIDGCLDITTTEIADEICGGILSAGPERLSASSRMGIPQVVAPGCVDMVNFGGSGSIPDRYRDANRNLYEWNSSVTLMRTNVEENIKIGEFMANQLNKSPGPVEVVIPLRGFSILDEDGELFCDREADQALIDSLNSHLLAEVEVSELDCNINDPKFADTIVEKLKLMLAARNSD